MLRAFLTIGSLQALTMFVNLGRTKSLALLLGPEWIGIMAVTDRLLGLVAQSASLSMPYAAVRFLPELWERDHDAFARLSRRFRNLLGLMSVLAVSTALTITLFAPGVWGEELRPYRHVLVFAFLSLPVVMLVPLLENLFAARLQHDRAMVFALGHAAVAALAAVVGVMVAGLSGLYALYAILGSILVIRVLRVFGSGFARMAQPARAPPHVHFQLPRRVWRFSLTFAALTFAAPFASLFVHYEVLKYFGTATAGWMAAAMGVAFFLRNLLGRTHALFMTPHINRGGSVHERMIWIEAFQRTFSFVCVLAVLPVLLFPHLIITLVFSSEFLPGAPFVVLFVIAEIVILMAGAYQGLIVALDHLNFHVAQNLVAQAALLGVASVAVPPYGILGAGLATMAMPAVLYVGSTLFLRIRYRVRLTGRTASLTGYVLASAAIAGWVGARYADLSVEVFVAKAIVFSVLAGTLGLFVTRSERAQIRQLWIGKGSDSDAVGDT